MERANDKMRVPLYERAPVLAERLPRVPLGHFPTPVQQHTVTADDAAIPLLVKRDDLCADGYAGNKVRKLEFILSDARACGATRLITAGAAGSHHAFATAYHGTRHGFDVSLVLFPQPLNDHVRTMLQLDAQVGAELCWASRMETVPYGLWRARFRHRAERTYMVPPGGSSDVGTLGYINGGLELADQIAAGDAPRPGAVYVAAGTLGTVVGIAIGFAWAGLDVPIRAIRITSRLLTNERLLTQLTRSTLARLRAAGVQAAPTAEEALRLVTLRHEFNGGGYGKPTPAGDEATASFDRIGLRLDPTYTAKAASALIADALRTSDAAGGGASRSDADGPADAAGLPLFWQTLSAIEPELARAERTLPAPFARYIAG